MCNATLGPFHPEMVNYHENGDFGSQITKFHENWRFWVKWGVPGPKGIPGPKKHPKPLRNDWFNSLLSEGAPPGPFGALFPLFTKMGEIW